AQFSVNKNPARLRLRGKNYREAHASTSLRAPSAGIHSPFRACSRALLIPARRSICRAISLSEVSWGSLVTSSITISRSLMVLDYWLYELITVPTQFGL